ncbi:uncharacterized protein LAJ45_07316 [Morchella importuna]|uniref:uncharacterized protein n=1 Tax=Morchella importuna TaxID=1174673 RepID=UPI001E8CFBDE|nr:uncharacterized protein LAJ45_07316 [Morchella importuna]KAH8148605.1 hypothetical protein LAJ45_07316 [Morchella importuna]
MEMAQPNFQILSDAAAASAQQPALMSNLPAVKLGGQLLQIQQTLQQVQQAMQQQGQQLQQQGQQLVQIQQAVQQIHQETSRSERNNFARLLNSSVNRSDTRLEVLYGLDNQPVQDFPETGADIGALTGPELSTLLGQLGLPVDGNVADCKRRFIKYIGLLNSLI